MKAKNILISICKFFTVVVFTLAATWVMAKLFPPPKGTAFDGLNYILKPFFVSGISGLIYLLLALTGVKYEKQIFVFTLLVNLIYVILLFIGIIT